MLWFCFLFRDASKNIAVTQPPKSEQLLCLNMNSCTVPYMKEKICWIWLFTCSFLLANTIFSLKVVRLMRIFLLRSLGINNIKSYSKINKYHFPMYIICWGQRIRILTSFQYCISYNQLRETTVSIKQYKTLKCTSSYKLLILCTKKLL